MKLWIDGQCLQTASTQRGIGRYVYELIAGIAEHCREVELSISFNAGMADEAIIARDLVGSWIAPENIHIWQGIAEGGEAIVGLTERRRLSELALAHHVACLGPDVALSASPFEGAGDPAVPLMPTTGLDVPVVAVFFDAIPFRYRREYLKSAGLMSFYDRRFKAHAGYDYLLGISRFATQEALELFPAVGCCAIDAGPSSSFLPAIAKMQRIAAAGRALPLPVEPPFLLYVGALDWRKNVGVVVNAYQHMPESVSSSLKFVIAGAYTSDAAELIVNRWRQLGLPTENLVMLGRVSDDVLACLYKEANLVIQPSLMEGFGLTALEAMICGSPVIGANAGALPEVIGDERALFDPQNPGQIAAMIADVYQNPVLARSLVERGREQAEKFSWKRSAELTVKALRNLLASGRHGARANGGDAVSADALAASRGKVAALARGIDVDDATKAKLFASAESRSRAAERVIVDISSTCALDHGTGIQRVAHSIVKCWSKPNGPASLPIQLVSCGTSPQYYNVELSNEVGRAKFRIDEGSQPHFGHGGRVILLDGSWDYHARHAVLLRKARLQGSEVITALYDLIPLNSSGFCAPGVPAVFCDGLRTSLQVSTGFVCISKAVADQFVALLTAIRFPRSMKIGYWHLGADFAPISAQPAISEAAAGALSRRPETLERSFLMVGTLEPRKGYRVAFDAFTALWRDGVDAKLVIVGKKGWGVDQLASEIAAHPEFGRRLFWFDRATDDELSAHYASCDAVIAASFTEGFGLPIVEASYFGKSMIASDIPVFREVAAGAPAHSFFEPGSASALARTVREYLDSRRDTPQRPVDERRAWLSWADSAAQLKDVVVGGNWYKTYEPAEASNSAGLNQIGDLLMRAPIPEDERCYSLELIDGPLLSADQKWLKYVVAFTNRSQTVWSSMGPQNVALGVFLSQHIIGGDGAVMEHGLSRVPIPFVLPPGERHYMSIDVSSDWRRRGGEFVDIEVLQEMVAWWGNALRVPLR